MRIPRIRSLFEAFAVASLIVVAASAIIVSATENRSEKNLDKLVEEQLKVEHEGDRRLLSRKRRYLTFPEGSSFQLVWDGIVGIVDYTNYLILGITVALAWELPSKPPSEIAEDLQTRLQDGTLGLRRTDTSENITYEDTKPKQQKPPSQVNAPLQPNYIQLSSPYKNYYQPIFQPPMNQRYYYAPPQKDAYYRRGPTQSPWSRKDNYYYKTNDKNPFTKWSQQQQRPPTSTNIVQYPWWNMASRISNAVRRPNNSFSQQQTQSKPQYYQNKPKLPTAGTSRQHRIYPVFGKRSIPDQQSFNISVDTSDERPHYRRRQKRHGIDHSHDELSKLEGIHIRHHRRTRHTLYGNIENYLDKLGQNGHHCVLRALCETGQKSHEHEPSSFVGELMRVVFTLPEPLDNDRLLYKEQRYDSANAYREDCAARYHHCKHSMWQSPFVM